MSRSDLLKEFFAKARCSYPGAQARARRALKLLQPLLTKQENTSIVVAWSHFRDCGEGPGELDSLAVKLRAKYD